MKRSSWLFLSAILLPLLGLYLWLKALPEMEQWFSIEGFKRLVEAFGIFGPLIFMGVYYALTLAFISAAALTVLSGILFGKLWGSVYVIIAATAAAQTAFYLTRRWGAVSLNFNRQSVRIQKLIQTIEQQSENHGLRNIFILRCLFAPYIPLSYAAGLVKTLKGKDFFVGTFLSNLIFSPALVFLGDALFKGPKALILPIIMVIVALLVPKLLEQFGFQRPNNKA